jgi:alkyl hydroperoxide reductase subunit D
METLLDDRTTTIAKDLRLNLSRVLESGALSAEEAHLALLAAASSVESQELEDRAGERLRRLGFPEDQIREARESAALMGMLNTYYRFRHFLGNPDEYRTAGLRMTALARPLLGKERFEILAFTVSVLNGCETCTRAHEKTLREAGVSVEKIHDLARLASVVRALKTLSQFSPRGREGDAARSSNS